MRRGKQKGSVFLTDQKLAVTVPRVRDRKEDREIPLATYAALQTPRASDVGLFRKVLGGLSCREYEAAAEAVPEALSLSFHGLEALHPSEREGAPEARRAASGRCRVDRARHGREDVRR